MSNMNQISKSPIKFNNITNERNISTNERNISTNEGNNNTNNSLLFQNNEALNDQQNDQLLITSKKDNPTVTSSMVRPYNENENTHNSNRERLIVDDSQAPKYNAGFNYSKAFRVIPIVLLATNALYQIYAKWQPNPDLKLGKTGTDIADTVNFAALFWLCCNMLNENPKPAN